MSDAFKHPEYITESFVPGKKTVAPNNAEQNVAPANPTAPIQQAENTTPVKKKKYIADYFR